MQILFQLCVGRRDEKAYLFFKRESITSGCGRPDVFPVPVDGFTAPGPQVQFRIVILKDQLDVHPPDSLIPLFQKRFSTYKIDPFLKNKTRNNYYRRIQPLEQQSSRENL